MKIIVDEINPQDCPFYVNKTWESNLPIEYAEGNCRLNTEPFYGELQQWNCYTENGENKECPFCITYDEFKRRMEKIKEEK